MKTRLLITAIALSTLVATAHAAEVILVGYTNGTFNGTPAANQAPAWQSASLLGLTYGNSQFSGTTVGGFLALNGIPTAPGIQNINNLGSFSLADRFATYTGNTFSLRTTFSFPPGINGSNSIVFTAPLMGIVTSLGPSGVFIDFDNTPQLFTFSYQNQNSTTTMGSFNFSVNDLSINPFQVIALTGQITSAQQSIASVPDSGATLTLLGGALLAIGLASRKLRPLALV